MLWAEMVDQVAVAQIGLRGQLWVDQERLDRAIMVVKQMVMTVAAVGVAEQAHWVAREQQLAGVLVVRVKARQ
tara:strand:+ start:374 stop:592 length:219 start_codon:yes stop_codon:yes gene_type:complete